MKVPIKPSNKTSIDTADYFKMERLACALPAVSESACLYTVS